jgi:hypothetical protein
MRCTEREYEKKIDDVRERSVEKVEEKIEKIEKNFGGGLNFNPHTHLLLL